MAGTGLNLKIIEEIRRLKSLGFGKRKIARTLGIHRNTVEKYFEISEFIKTEESTLLVPPLELTWVDQVDWPSVRAEIQTGVPVLIIYQELVERHALAIQYPAFWKQLQKRAPNVRSTMVRVFEPGARIEIDYCDGINLIDAITGEKISTELFVGVLCQSRYAFAEFTFTQKSEDFLASHVRMFEFFQGVSQVLSPDNLKSAVTKAHRYDPVINPAYTRLASHYNFAVVPARVRTPRDKAIVERTIQIFQKWFFMVVRNRSFTSLIELNRCLQEHLDIFNQKKHRIFGKSRLQMFQAEKEHLMPLPSDPYLVSTYVKAFLSRDCHLTVDYNYYSAPHALRGLYLDVWMSEKSVEVYHDGDRVAFHGRGKTSHKFITEHAHYPPEHQAYLEEDVVKMKSWSNSVGVETGVLVQELLGGPYPLKHLRRVQGILNLSTRYSKVELEAAAKVANRFNQKTIQYLERVIKTGSAQKQKGGEAIKREFNPHLRGIDKITVH